MFVVLCSFVLLYDFSKCFKISGHRRGNTYEFAVLVIYIHFNLVTMFYWAQRTNTIHDPAVLVLLQLIYEEAGFGANRHGINHALGI